jgi:hypothetical protein
MAAPGTPSNYYLQTANRQNYLSWNISAGATSYTVERSLDGVNYTVLASPTATNYTDESVSIGTQYWYRVTANNTDGSSNYTTAQSAVPAPTSEMSLLALRTACQQKADRLHSQFVTLPEWNTFINLAMYELYDLLITAYEDYYMAPRARFNTNGTSFQYPIPNGELTFQDQTGSNFVPQPMYKLLGVDLALSLNASQNAFVTLQRFNWIDRNKFVFPNNNSAKYGVYNPAYRMMGNFIEFIPTPSSNTTIQITYIPRLPEMVKDTDITTLGHSGWLNYVIVRAAKYALDKEESDTSKLDQEIVFLQKRIESSTQNRDAGAPQTISNTRAASGSGWGNGWNSFDGGNGGY